VSIRSIKKKETANQNPWTISYLDFPKDKDGIIYVRQSSIAQVKINVHSYEMQTEKFVEHFRNMGCTGKIEIVADDEAMSGTLDIHDRPGMTRMVQMIEKEAVGWVGAVHVNRFTRDPWLITPAVLMKICHDHHVWMATLRMNFNFDDDYCQRVFMLEAEESARHLKWMKLVLGGGKNTASNNGYYDGRFLSPGYIVDRSDPLRKKYIIYRPHAEIVAWLFQRFFELDGNFPALRREVEEMPYLFPEFEPWVDHKNIGKFLVRRIKDGPYKGNYKPSEKGLRSILTNPVYIGWWLPLDGGCIENNHEPIIDDELFTYAHKRLSTHDLNGERQKPAVTKNGSLEAILKKVIKDSRGHAVYAKADKQGYYVVCTYGSLSQHYEVSVRVKKIDEVFLEKFLERVQSIDPERFSDWEDVREQMQRDKESREENIRKQLVKAQERRQAVLDVLTNPDMPKTKQMLIDLSTQCAGLEEKIAKLEKDLTPPPVEEEEEDEAILYEISTLIPRITELWPRLPFLKRMRFIGALVRKVVLRSVVPSWLEIQIEWKMEGWGTDIAYIKESRGTGSKWTAEEEQALRDLYPSSDVETIRRVLPNRSWMGIINHAKKLNIARVSYYRSERGTRVEDKMALADEEFMKEHGIARDKKVHWSA